MKKIALTTAAMLLGLVNLAQADDTAPATKPATTCCSKDKCCGKAPCCKTDKGITCGEQAWLDIETVTLEAANGDPIAQYTVAYLTETGDDNAAPDTEKANEWYAKALPGLEKAAAEGHPTACRALAHMYAEGKGVEKNPEMAEKYMKMYKELCEKKWKEWKEKCKGGDKACCAPESAPAPAPEQPAGN